MPRIDTDFAQYTRDLWQSKSKRQLVDEDVRQITDNVCGFISILQEWSAKQRPETGDDK